MKYKRKSQLSEYGKAAADLASIGVISGVGSAVANKIAPDSGLSGTIGSFGSIAGTVYLGGFALKQVKKLNKRMY